MLPDRDGFAGSDPTAAAGDRVTSLARLAEVERQLVHLGRLAEEEACPMMADLIHLAELEAKDLVDRLARQRGS
jgi:polyhydroxyalkanoate synthesis regulator phasin